MSDIVSKLREPSEVTTDWRHVALHHDAAEEIERLRAENSKLKASDMAVAMTEMSLRDEIARLRARVAELERQHPVIPTAGCQCPPGANIHCANSWCPRKSLSFRVTSTSK